MLTGFDPPKSLDDYVFNLIPNWLRVMKLPLDMMNHRQGVSIGDDVGEFLEVETGDDDMEVEKRTGCRPVGK